MKLEAKDLLHPFLRPEPYVYVSGTIPGEPEPKPRARIVPGKNRVYSSKKQVEAEKYVGFHLRRRFRKPMEGKLSVCLVFRRSRHQVADSDNLEKLFMDAGNGIAWKDDRQVVIKSTVLLNGCAEGSTTYSICTVPDFHESIGYSA